MSGSKLKIDIRRNKILQKLRQTGRVSVVQLSKELGATQVTIRSDLASMERDGLLLRVQGGAVMASPRGGGGSCRLFQADFLCRGEAGYCSGGIGTDP